jgi:hypothetical protein
MATKKQSDNELTRLERGNIYFFYQPRVEELDPDDIGDLQRLYVLLNPEHRKRYRLITIGQKRLADPAQSGGKPQWGFVDFVANTPKQVREALESTTYRTKTRGERLEPAARAAGEGVYRILRHGDHTHLVYALELPKATGDVQEQLEIEPEASYIISIANPERSAPKASGLGKARQADYPQKLKDVFRNRKFADADPPEFLDYEGAELVLVPAAADIDKDLGIELDTENETTASGEIFKDLRIDRSELPTEPLLEREWE